MHWPCRLRRVYAPLFSPITFAHSMFFFFSSNIMLYLTNTNKRQNKERTTHYFGKSLGLAHPLHQHHHFLLLGWKGWKFLPNQGFNSLEKLHIIPMVIWTPDTCLLAAVTFLSKPQYCATYSTIQKMISCQNGIQMAISGNKTEMLLYMEWLVTIKRPFLLSDESDGFPGSSCSGCSANSVNIVL